MRISISLLVASLFFSMLNAEAETNAIRYYVQLIRGTDVRTPPLTSVRRVGPKLREKFGSLFKEKNYWEIKRQEVIIVPGHSAKVYLNEQRAVKIDLNDTKRTVTTFYEGRAINRASSTRGDGMTLIGDNLGKNGCWFIVVRRDTPGS